MAIHADKITKEQLQEEMELPVKHMICISKDGNKIISVILNGPKKGELDLLIFKEVKTLEFRSFDIEYILGYFNNG